MSVTIVLVIITLAVTYFGFQNAAFFNRHAHKPYYENHAKEWFRLLTSGFLHGSWLHFGINMFVFWQFGTIVEHYYIEIFGPMKGMLLYGLIYLLIIVAANIPTMLKHRDNHSFASIGASGAVSGILFIYVLFLPWQMLWLWAIIPIPGIVAAIGYLVYSSYASKKGGGRIDHSAHFWGAIFGVLFTLLLKPSIFNFFLDRLVNDFPL